MRRLLVSLVTLLAWTATSTAAPPAWVASGPEGGSLFLVARSASDPSTVFAAGDRVWKLTDGGAHWAPYGKRMIRVHVSDLEVGPGPVDNVMIVANGDVYRSTAGGPWERSTGLGEPEFFPAEELARGNANPNLMLAMTAWGLIGPESQCYPIATDYSINRWRPDMGSRANIGERCAVPPAAPPDAYDDSAQLSDASDGAIDGLDPRDQPLGSPIALAHQRPRPHLAARDRTAARRQRRPAAAVRHARRGRRARRGLAPPGRRRLVDVRLWHVLRSGAGNRSWSTPFGCAGSAGIAFAAVAGPAGGRAPIGVGQTFPGVYRETGTGWVPSVAGLTAQIARSATRLGDGSVVMTGDSTFRQAADGSWAPVDGRHRHPRRRRPVQQRRHRRRRARARRGRQALPPRTGRSGVYRRPDAGRSGDGGLPTAHRCPSALPSASRARRSPRPMTTAPPGRGRCRPAATSSPSSRRRATPPRPSRSL